MLVLEKFLKFYQLEVLKKNVFTCERKIKINFLPPINICITHPISRTNNFEEKNCLLYTSKYGSDTPKLYDVL